MNLLRNSKAERQTGKKVVKVDAEYYSDLQCNADLIDKLLKAAAGHALQRTK